MIILTVFTNLITLNWSCSAAAKVTNTELPIDIDVILELEQSTPALESSPQEHRHDHS